MDTYTEAPPLLTADDLLDLELQGTYAETDVAVACALVRGACGWHIGPSVDVDLTLDVEGGTVLLLPSLHVTAVSEVRDREGNLLEGWEWSDAGILRRPGGWPVGLRAVTVSLSHGLESIPLDLASVVAGIAATRADGRAVPVGLKSRAIGGITYTYADAPKDGDSLAAYDHVLWRYKR